MAVAPPRHIAARRRNRDLLLPRHQARQNLHCEIGGRCALRLGKAANIVLGKADIGFHLFGNQGGGRVARRVGHDDLTIPAVKIDGTPMTGGYISIQAETAPADFRKIEVLNLEGCMDPKSSTYKSYFVKANPQACK